MEKSNKIDRIDKELYQRFGRGIDIGEMLIFIKENDYKDDVIIDMLLFAEHKGASNPYC